MAVMVVTAAMVAMVVTRACLTVPEAQVVWAVRLVRVVAAAVAAAAAMEVSFL